jgi:hypothetical protein
MTKADEDFFRLLHKQMAEHRRDQGLTTIRALERRKNEQPTQKSNRKNPPKNR